MVELAGLTRLDVSGCSGLTDAVLKVIQFHGPHLKRLVCVDCAGFTSDPLSELYRAPSTRSLDDGRTCGRCGQAPVGRGGRGS